MIQSDTPHSTLLFCNFSMLVAQACSSALYVSVCVVCLSVAVVLPGAYREA
jgi:hypothetical protein